MTIRLSARAGGGSKAPLGRLVSANTTITAGDLGSVVSVDTSAGAVTLTMPGSPSINDTYYFLDAKANWGVNPVTLSSALYYGTTQTFALDIGGGLIVATWRGAPTGWTVGGDNPSLDNTQLNTLMSLLATQANPSFTGVPNAPTAALGTNSTQLATTAFVANAVAGNVGSTISRTVTAATDTVTVSDKYKAIAVDTTSNGVTLTLPTTGLTAGDQYTFLDAKANWGNTPAVLASATFFSSVQTVSLDTTGDVVTATWRGLPIGWTVGTGASYFDSTTLNSLYSLKAALASPTFSGVPAAPTASTGTSTTQLATTAFVNNTVNNYFGPAVSNSTSAATYAVVAGDKNLAVAVDTTTNATVITLPASGQVVGDTYSFLDAKANWGVSPASLASATFFGTTQTVTLDTVGAVATVIWRGLPIGWTVASGTANFDNTTLNTIFSTKAPLASPALTGTPTVPTATAGTNTTQAASTAFVQTALTPAIGRTVTAATDAVSGTDKSTVIAVDTTTNATVITLPTTGQVVGDKYSFLDAKNNWGVNPASFASATFFGTVQTVSLDSPGNLITATWRGLPIGWSISSGSANFDSTTLNTLFSVKAPIDTPTFTGIPAAPTAAVGTSTTQVATTAYVQGEVTAINNKTAMVATATMLSANTTLTSAYKGQLTPIDTSAGVVQITLPVSGNVLNDTYGFYDPKGTWSTNNVTFVVGTVHSQATTLVGDLSNVGVFLKYINPTIGWIRI